MPRTELVVTLGDCFFSVERPWGVVPAGIELSHVARVAVDSEGYVFVLQQRNPPIVVFDNSGKYVRDWGTDVISDPHGLTITEDDLVLIVDRDAHQVLGFDRRGHLELTLGTRHTPKLQQPFNHPTDVTRGHDGDYFISDGYGNSSVHRFSSAGDWKNTWGRPGTGPGELTTPHAIRFDGERLLVADRENNRVQLFGEDGRYLGEWGDFYRPMGLYVDNQRRTYVTDQISRLSMLTADGVLVGRCRPVRHGAHGVCGDREGNLYLGETVSGNGLTKLVPLKP